MFYYKFLIILSIITIGLSKSLSNEPKRCCLPKQFSSKISLSTGVVLPDGSTYISYGHYNFSYDANKQMVGIKGLSIHIPDKQQTNVWIIENSKTEQVYTIDIDTKQCQKSTMPIKSITCIPDTAIYMHSSTYGHGNKKITGDTWMIKIDETITYSTVSRDDCIPLTSYIYDLKSAAINSLTLTDFIPHIHDPTIFDIPSQCQTLI